MIKILCFYDFVEELRTKFYLLLPQRQFKYNLISQTGPRVNTNVMYVPVISVVEHYACVTRFPCGNDNFEFL